jgi:hypothetical protein
MEPQTPIDVQRILERKRKRAEYDKQRKLKRKIDSESLTAIGSFGSFHSCITMHGLINVKFTCISPRQTTFISTTGIEVAARHGTAGERHGRGMLCVNPP